jgi:two-component system chemotaxis response regulator CheB
VPNHDIIVIGGSTGATAPLNSMLGSLGSDLKAAVFVVMHTSPTDGILATVTKAATSLPVHEVIDGMAIEPGHVYVSAPDHHLLLEQEKVRLGRGPRENLARPAIDPLFRSAAITYGPRVVGVVLSGLLNDGASGLSAIKRCGGYAVVQSPEDAVADGMPRRALQCTQVDFCVPSARLGYVVAGLTSDPAGPRLPVPPGLRLEVDIAAGGPIDSPILERIARPVALTCPDCLGVLSQISEEPPLRFRCQVGHAYTAHVLANEQQGRVDEAMRVALRIIEERAELVSRMASGGREAGRPAVAAMYDERAAEYRAYAERIREVLMERFDATSTRANGEP